MKDDYLWDGSGEPDPDVEKLEKLLGGYRYQSRPPDARIENQLGARRGALWFRDRFMYAAAAAIILMLGAGVWFLLPRNLSESELISIAWVPEPVPESQTVPSEWIQMSLPEAARSETAAASRATGSGRASDPPALSRPNRPSESSVPRRPLEAIRPASEMAFTAPAMNPFVDPETARHIERAQVLLRSFRNTEGDSEFDLSYERKSSRQLLVQNVLLRRNAETNRNLPVQELLGSLEPFLIDIANLPDTPGRDDVRAIKTQMEKKDIVAALQVYSAPIISRTF